MLKAVLFDMDGLIFNTEEIYKHSWQLAAREQGLDLKDNLYQHFLGVKDSECESILAQHFIGVIDIERFKRIRDKDFHLRREKNIEIKSGFPELFEVIKKHGLKTALVTSSSLTEVRYNFRNTEYLSQYDIIITAEDVENGKPAPDCYLLACSKLSISPGECLVLEDSNNGARAAVSAKCNIIMVPDLQPVATDITHIDQVSDLKKVIPYLSKL